MSRLADSTWPEVEAGGLVLVPVGSVEQHGPHLPLDTDSAIATAAAVAAAARLGAQVTPPLCFGSSGEHQSFAGTVSMGTDALHLVLVELARSLRTWCGAVLFVNGHGGNLPAMNTAIKRLRTEGHAVSGVSCTTEGTDLHAGRTETSLMLHLRPGEVRLEKAVAGDSRPLHEILPLMVAGGVSAVSTNGVLGDPAGASAAEGARVLEELVSRVIDAGLELSDLTPESMPR